MHTSYVVASLLEKTFSAFESGGCLLGLFCDLSRAFDVVDHKIILNKLFEYRIRGKAYSCFLPVLKIELNSVKIEQDLNF